MLPWTHPQRTLATVRRIFDNLRTSLTQPFLCTLFLRLFYYIKKRITPLVKAPKRKALLIGIRDVRPRTPIDPKVTCLGHRKAGSATIKQQNILKGPHRDVLDLTQVLIDVYGYDPDDIMVLIDDDDPERRQPTRENVLEAMKDLLEGAAAGDQYFFHFSGHCTQQDTDDRTEEDGKDEYMMTSDGMLIKDDELRTHLVRPLPFGSRLVAVFDSCHSATLLDLPHFRCNRVYVPWMNKGKRKTDMIRNIVQRKLARVISPITPHFRQSDIQKRLSIEQVMESPIALSGFQFTAQHAALECKTPLTINTKSLMDVVCSQEPEPFFASPRSVYCHGWCRDMPLDPLEPPEPWEENHGEVIALSSSKDGERTWEDSQGASMTQALIRILRENRNPTLRQLLMRVSHELHKAYLALHEKSRLYKEQVRAANIRRELEGKKPKRARTVEMDNFQNPQFSSAKPLDLDALWQL